jgi:HEAT repeat protein
LKHLVDFLATQAKDDADREAAEQAIVGLARMNRDVDARGLPVAAALPSASDMSNRAALLRVLGRLGGTSALPAIRDALKNTDPQVRDAGVRALANWPAADETALGDLRELAQSAENNTHRVLALRAYLRLAGQRQLSADKRLAMYRDGLALAKSAEDRRLALAGLADLGDIRALPLVAPLLEDSGVQQEAAAAVVRVTRDVKAPNPEAREVLKKTLAVARDERVRREARSRLQTLGGE